MSKNNLGKLYEMMLLSDDTIAVVEFSVKLWCYFFFEKILGRFKKWRFYLKTCNISKYFGVFIFSRMGAWCGNLQHSHRLLMLLSHNVGSMFHRYHWLIRCCILDRLSVCVWWMYVGILSLSWFSCPWVPLLYYWSLWCSFLIVFVFV